MTERFKIGDRVYCYPYKDTIGVHAQYLGTITDIYVEKYLYGPTHPPGFVYLVTTTQTPVTGTRHYKTTAHELTVEQLEHITE